jgi:hypothetical protein
MGFVSSLNVLQAALPCFRNRARIWNPSGGAIFTDTRGLKLDDEKVVLHKYRAAV